MAYLGRQPISGNFQVLDAIIATTTDTYALTKDTVAVFPQTPANCIVSLNGVIQAPTDSYTISGSDIVFASALTGSDSIDFITVLGDVLNIGTPSDGTVTFPKVTSNLITGATAETAPATDDVLLFYDTSATALRKITFADFGNTPAFEAHLSASQTSITDATYTKVNNNTEIFDTDNAYDNATNYRFTPQVAGKYFVYSGIAVSGSANDAIINSQNAIYKNGSAYRTLDQNSGSTSANYHAANLYNYAIIDMNGTTDYLELFGRVDVSSGTVIFYFNNSVKSAFFGAYRLIGV
jgi:hypothetical protein